MVEQEFAGFPARAEVTPIPNLFFASVLPLIDDISELKAILYIFWLVSRRGGNRFASFTELVSKGWLREDELKRALTKAVEHKVLLSLEAKIGNKIEEIYAVNDVAGRREMDKIRQGKVPEVSLLPDRCVKSEKPAELTNIFRLYEQNIGLLTPMIADELREAEKLYPWEWIESAFREAVTLNKRNWKYISRILERWAAEGKDDGKIGRYSKKGVDREKYVRGKYGHLVKR